MNKGNVETGWLVTTNAAGHGWGASSRIERGCDRLDKARIFRRTETEVDASSLARRKLDT
jgi:hypothetical protein